MQSYKVLGAFEARQGDSLSELMASKKGSALVAYLIVNQGLRQRELLADLLWEATSATQSLRNLRSLLNRVRKWIPELRVVSGALAFEPTDSSAIDLHIFRANVEADNTEAAVQAMQQYGGNFLEGFYLDGAPRLNEWVLLTRERLRQEMLVASERLCERLYDAADWQNGITITQQRIGLEPLDESGYRWSMRFLAGDGQFIAAQQQFETCQRVLWDELGVEPEAKTTELARQVQLQAQHDSHQAVAMPTYHEEWTGDSLPSPGSLPVTSIVLHHRNDDFVGRDEELFAIGKRLLLSKSVERAVVIAGMGGLGKTQLAVEFAFRFGRFFPGGVFWLSFAQAENIPAEIAQTGHMRGLGLFKDSESLTLDEQVGKVLQEWQADRKRLLIFDNCEDEALLTRWLPNSGGCRVLVTSRRTSFARELPIQRVLLDVLSRAHSVAMLQHMTPRINPTIADQIATELGDLPLALHLAGSFLARYQHVTPESYIAQLRRTGLLSHPSLTGRGTDFSPTGHELHVGRTFALNMEQLASDGETNRVAQLSLAHAAMFSPSEAVPRQLLVRITLDSELPDDDALMAELLIDDGIERLITLGFLRSASGKMVAMHPLIAAFVQANTEYLQLAKQGVINSLIGILRKFEQRTGTLVPCPIPENQLRFVAIRGLESPDDEAMELGVLFGRYLLERNDFDGAQAIFENTLQLYQQLNGEFKTQITHTLILIGSTFTKRGEFDNALSYFDGALKLVRTIPDDTLNLEARAYVGIAELHSKAGRSDEALQFSEQALDLYKATVGMDHLETARCLRQRGTIFIEMGDFDQARQPYEQALAFYERNTGVENVNVSRVQANLGWIYLQEGLLEQAQARLEAAFDTQKESLGLEHQFTLSTLHSLGQLYYAQGNYESAESTLASGLQLRLKLVGPKHHTTAFMQNDLGLVKQATGDYDAALQLLLDAHATRVERHGSHHTWTARSLNHLGKLHGDMGLFEKAEEYLTNALAINEGNNPTQANTADSLDFLGELYTRMGRMDEAHKVLKRAQAIRSQVHGEQHPSMAYTLNRLAVWHRSNGDVDAARRLTQQTIALLAGVVLETHRELVEARGRMAQVSLAKSRAGS